MISELKNISGSIESNYDVCIVGAGPAGITLALKLNKAGKKVALLEAGSFGPNKITEALKSGNKSTGQWYNVEGSRLIQLGGTSGHWAGYCAELDKEDYVLNGLDNIKWPFEYEELDTYNKEANEILELGNDPSPPALENDEIKFKDTFVEKMWRFSTPVRFGEKYRTELEASDIDIFMGALARKVNFKNSSSNRIESIEVLDENKSVHDIKASQFVLSQGALEVARFLLGNKQSLQPRMADSFDFVGRYFADHPHLLNIGTALLFGQNATSKRYQHFKINDFGYASFFQIAPDLRREMKLNNLVIRLEWDKEDDEYSKAFSHFLSKNDLAQNGIRRASVSLMGEQLPNAESSISLLHDKNDYGISCFNFKWKSQDADFRSMRKTLELFGKKLGENGIGRLFLNEKYHSEKLTKQLYGGNHHLGTTRMSAEASNGATDSNAKLWGVDNAFVCSSSLFPTYGAANPTYNIVRLALRLSNHLSYSE
ncbi:MAG: GMC family oxidoreductase [Bacteroidia bacterium]